MDYKSFFQNVFPFYANEWVNRQTAYQLFFQQLHAANMWPESKAHTLVTDHGVGTGENLALFAHNLSAITGKETLRLRAVDCDISMITEASKRLQNLSIEYKINFGDGLPPTTAQLRKVFDLDQDEYISIALAEHVMYYILNNKKKLADTLGSIFSLMHPNAVFISVLSRNADSDVVRQRYSSFSPGRKIEPSKALAETFQSFGLSLYEIPLKAELIDPELTDEEWGNIACGLVSRSNAPNQKILNAITLLEFCVDNYENLSRKRILTATVKDFRERIKKGFTIDSVIQIVPSKDSSPVFHACVEAAAKLAGKEILKNGSHYRHMAKLSDVESYRASHF